MSKEPVKEPVSPPPHPLEQFVKKERLDRLEQSLDVRTGSLTVVLDDIKNYHNVSAIMRTADAFALTELHFVGGPAFDYSPGISLGSERWIGLRRFESAKDAVSALKARGFLLVTVEAEDPSLDAKPIPVTELPFEKKLALVFGNELQGVSPVFKESADIASFIPMYGFAESLNVSVACAICLFCSTITQTSPGRRSPALTADEREEVRSRWLTSTVKRSDVVLRELEGRRKV